MPSPGRCWCPRIGNAAEFARFVWPALGPRRGDVQPVRLRRHRYFNYPLGRKALDEATLEAFAAHRSPARARRRATGRGSPADNPTWGAAKGADGADRETTAWPLESDRAVRPLAVRRGRLDLASRATSIRSRTPRSAARWWPSSGPNQFLVTGSMCDCGSRSPKRGRRAGANPVG
jgi:hypothetical protein